MADAPKKRRAAAAPRPFYLVYSIVDDKLVEHAFSRKTDEVLDALDANEGSKTLKLMAPPGR